MGNTQCLGQRPERSESKAVCCAYLKTGIARAKELVISLLDRFKDNQLDYTINFDLLTQSLESESIASQMKNELGESFDLWRKRVDEQTANPIEVQRLMRQHNPVVIPRNHHVEAAIKECEQNGKVALVEELLHVLRTPYEVLPQTAKFQDSPSDGDVNYKTYCGT